LCDGGSGKERRKMLEEGGFVAFGIWCSSLNQEGSATSFKEARRKKKGRKGVSYARNPTKNKNAWL
jgi:hypothetical protein